VDGELGGDVHVGRSLEDLGVVDVGDDGLKLAGEVFVEEVDELLASGGVLVAPALDALAVSFALSFFDLSLDISFSSDCFGLRCWNSNRGFVTGELQMFVRSGA
jgi:hypothetical protein